MKTLRKNFINQFMNWIVSFYPERIYLSPDKKFVDSILSQLKDKKKDEEYVKLRIKNYPELKFFIDLNCNKINRILLQFISFY
jgi:hypothetical protein